MARKSESSTQRLAVRPFTNGHANGDPPPSTIAAQIVSNVSNVHSEQPPEAKKSFADLLKDFLVKPITDEPESELTALIAVLVEACIDPLFKDDPFAIDRLREQGLDSIIALGQVFQARPHMLLNPREAEDDDSPRPPNFVWLFPKFLGLLDKAHLQPLHANVRELLTICFGVLERSLDSWRQGAAILELYKSCVDDVLVALELSSGDGPTSSPFKLLLPPSSSTSALWPDSQQYIALPQNVQRAFRSQPNAAYIGLCLIQSIQNASHWLSKSNPGVSDFEHHLPWMLESGLRLWREFLQWSSTSQYEQLKEHAESMYIYVLDSIALPTTDVGKYFSTSPKAILALADNLSDLIHSCSICPFTQANQISLASLLTRVRRVVQQLPDPTDSLDHRTTGLKGLIIDCLEEDVAQICQNEDVFISLQQDLQAALCLWTSQGTWPPQVAELRESICADGVRSFSVEQLQEDSVAVVKSFQEGNVMDEDRPAKRRRTLPGSPEDESQTTYDRLVVALNGSSQDSPVLNLSNLHNIVQAKYSNMSEELSESEKQQEKLVAAFEKIACAGSGCLQPTQLESVRTTESFCMLCDLNQCSRDAQKIYWNESDCGEDWKEAIAAMLAVTEEEKFNSSSKPRVLMALAIGRVFNHISEPEYLNLENCALGQWLLKSMSRSLRELRIAAAQSLIVFLRDDISKTVRDKNRRSTIEFFHVLSERNSTSDQEALIMAYGQAARVCSEVELPIILNQLVEYLGHTNALICGMAYNELSRIADDFKMGPMDLLRPYWRVIGYSVIKDIHSNPQKIQHIADLTEQSVNQLLEWNHTEILPDLVLRKRQDILTRIAAARKCSVEHLLTQVRKNLSGVLALLLCQPVQNPEANAMATLTSVAPGIKAGGTSLETLISSEVVETAIEILKLAADQDATNKSQYHRGFNSLAVLAAMKNGQRKTASKRRTLDSFFDAHILGIMAYFSEVLNNTHAAYSRPERKRCVGAIGEMITIATGYASTALPQLRACLQSAMSDPYLCDQAFSVWNALLSVLDDEELSLVIDQTFALIVTNWEQFSDDTHAKIYEAIQNLIKQKNGLLQEQIDSIPSLASIPMLSKVQGELAAGKAKADVAHSFDAFSNRCTNENAILVRQALTELVPFLEENQKLLHQSAISQKPMPALTALGRSLLDASVRFSENDSDIPILCAQCLGIVGALDPYRVETVRERKQIVVLTNFQRKDEVLDFCAHLLEHILVKAFLSTTNARAQGFIAYVMQELLKTTEFNTIAGQNPRSSQATPASRRWHEIPEATRNALSPFTTSKYVIRAIREPELPTYPIFREGISHANWLRDFVFGLLHRGKGENPEMLFPVLARIIRGHDLSIASFILPFAALNVVVAGEEIDMMNVGGEMLRVLDSDIDAKDQSEAAAIKQCSENVFQTLDYFTLWLQEKRKSVADARIMAGKTGRGISEMDEIEAIQQISAVERTLQMIPAEVISQRAVECGSYARALFHWEQYYRQEQAKADDMDAPFAQDEMLQHLQMIYAQIDEPDSIEGISTHLQILNPEQQIMEHRKAGRWTAAQSWYELSLAERPNDTETQFNLLTCLRESGQYDSILNYVDGFHASNSFSTHTLPFAAEAAWSTGKWEQLKKILMSSSSLEDQDKTSLDFNVGVGKALLALNDGSGDEFTTVVQTLREALAKSLTPTITDSLQASHDILVKLHALYEMETISGMSKNAKMDREAVLENLDLRLDILGAYTSDKQYLLGIRRAAMQLSQIEFTNLDVASAWLTTARLARKGDFTSTAFNSVLHAARLGDDASKIEYSKMLWKEGHHRKAIQNLQGAISSNVFQNRDTGAIDMSVTTSTTGNPPQSNRVRCHAQLLVAKWLDRSGQTKSLELKSAYTTGITSFPRWDKGHYYLGRYYLKLFEAEKKLPLPSQSRALLGGEVTKLCIDNFVRSTVYGTKHYYQTIPKILTLWLDLGMEVHHGGARTGKDREFMDLKTNQLDNINKYIKRYTSERMPAYAWYTAFPQIITRISHPHPKVWEVLQIIIIRVASQYPQQALWSLLAVPRATAGDRSMRGAAILQKLRDNSTKRKGNAIDLKNLIIHGQRLTDQLLAACDTPVEQRASHVSLSKHLNFNHKIAPSQLVVPIEATLMPSLPNSTESKVIRAHNPFPQDVITIASFEDDVLVLSSLQRPRKLTVRGSDGRQYALLCKPKDDLRKDQRLMEFNAMINRALQRDIESSKRRLYIKTYGVTPLNEECGTIEWVNGLKPMRDIIIRLYRRKNIEINYGEIRTLLNEACSNPPTTTPIFTHKILPNFPPVLHEWFIDTFPEPEAWFAARLRYTRSCAVMSIAGNVLGLGDRHGENVLLEEDTGGTFHVDFNCLFDKGLSFEKPELVPFRLTHNMVDAMGPQGVEGPFRKAAELTYKLLRQIRDTLITILETFVHDPTADFLGNAAKRKKRAAAAVAAAATGAAGGGGGGLAGGVPETPQEVLDAVRAKVDGMLRGESVPLSVEGYVDALIAGARDHRNLAAMYIGWCAFF